nr:C69 family dipeptidase [Lactobacillus amylolyticus]
MRYTAMPELEETIKKTGWWGEAGINAANVAMSATETSTTNSRILGIDPMNKRALARKTLSPSSCLIFILLVKACNYWVNI